MMQGMTQLFHSRTRFLLIFICIGGTTPMDWGMASVSTLRTFAHKMVLVHCHCNLQSRNYKKNFMDVGFAVPSVLDSQVCSSRKMLAYLSPLVSNFLVRVYQNLILHLAPRLLLDCWV